MEQETQNPPPKRKGNISAEIKKATAQQVWPFFEDFFGIYKWFPSLPISIGVVGVNGEPGCVRYCSGFTLSSIRDGNGSSRWARERLVSIDHGERTLRYETVDSNIGFQSYSAEFKVVPGSKDSCRIEWLFEVDPVEGCLWEDLVKAHEAMLQGIVHNIEDIIAKGHAKTKWEGKATARVEGMEAEQVWPLLEDFCRISKWLPGLDTSYKLDGASGQPGLIRYCASTDGDEEAETKWCHEKLLAIDPAARSLSYEVLDNNLGFKSYVSIIEVLDGNNNSGDGGHSKHGCEIEWCFVSDPVEGWASEDLLTYINASLQGMAENMRKALLLGSDA